MKARNRTTPPGAGPNSSPPLPFLQSSLSPTPPPLSPGAGGGSPPPDREIRAPGSWRPLPEFQPLVIPFQIHASTGQPRLPLAISLPPTAPVGIDAVAPGVAGVTLGGVACRHRRLPVSDDVGVPRGCWIRISLFRCPFTLGSPPDDGASPSGGVTPAAKGLLSRAGPVPSAMIPGAAGVALGCLRGGQASRNREIPVFSCAVVLHGYISSASWLRLPPYPRANFRHRSCSFRWRYSPANASLCSAGSVPSGFTLVAIGEGGSAFPASYTCLDPRVHAAVGKGGSTSPCCDAFQTLRFHLVRWSSMWSRGPPETLGHGVG